MSADSLFALIFIGAAWFSAIIGSAINVGFFDKIAIKICDYIVSRMERIEREDI